MRRSRPGGGGKRKRPEQVGRFLGAGARIVLESMQGFMLLIGPPAGWAEKKRRSGDACPPKASMTGELTNQFRAANAPELRIGHS
jgi:hypothetical protein